MPVHRITPARRGQDRSGRTLSRTHFCSLTRNGFGAVDQLSMVNVAVQVETLTTHPLVAGAHREGRLNIIGLFYDIASAQALQVDPTGVSAFDGQPIPNAGPPQRIRH